MAITLVGVFEGATNAETPVVVALSNTAANDVVYGFQKATTDVGGTPAGYTLVGDLTFSISNVIRAYRKVLSAADADITFSADAGGDNDANCCVVVVLRGVNNITPEDATTTTETGTSTTPDSPSITTVTNGAWVISAFGATINDTAVTAPGGYSNQVDISINGDDTNGTVGAATKEIVDAGAENPPSWTNLASAGWGALSVAVKPETPGPGTSTAVPFTHIAQTVFNIKSSMVGC